MTVLWNILTKEALKLKNQYVNKTEIDVNDNVIYGRIVILPNDKEWNFRQKECHIIMYYIHYMHCYS